MTDSQHQLGLGIGADDPERDPSSAPDGLDTAILRKALAARLFDDEPYRVGRFTVMRRLGAGGMGVVYLAYDADLDREVAVKLLRPELAFDDPEQAKRRVLREAQAMARLRHPNVVTVHEVGEHESGVYVAMEYVRGSTLRGWLQSTRSRSEILAAFVAAGRGLAAAHAAGLVHRDFKPDNVLVGDDGRICVTDFGLARLEDNTPASTEVDVAAQAQLTTHDELASSIRTVSSGIAGTPAYMASECFMGRSATIASDQFSFCVALYEALWGERPFGETLASVATAVTTQRKPVPPTRPRMPAKIREAVLRGLSHEPGDRFASMEELLGVLARDPAQRQRRVLVGIGAAVVVGGLGWMAVSAPTPCTDLDTQLRAAWNEERRASIAAAFVEVGPPFAERTWSMTAERVDGLVDEWSEQAREACRATLVQHTQSVELLDRRNACLDRRRRELVAVIDVFAAPDDVVIGRAVQAVERLPRPSSCSDMDALGRRVPPPSEPAAQAEYVRLTDAGAAARAAYETGRYADARALAEPLVDDAVALGHRPTEADVRLVLGDALDELGDEDRSRAEIERAITAAEAGGADEVSARAWLDLGYLEAWSHNDFARADRAADFAAAEIEGLGNPPRLHAALLKLRGSIMIDRGDFDEGESLLRAALEEMERKLPADSFEPAAVHLSIGIALYGAGRFEASLTEMHAAVDGFTRALGPEHPHTLSARSNLANVLNSLRRVDEALTEHREVLALRERSLGPDHSALAANLTGIAGALYYREEHAAALEYQRRAAALYERVRGHDHIETLAARENLGVMLAGAGQHAQALLEATSVLESRRRVEGPDHPDVVSALESVGNVLHALDRNDEASATLAEAIALGDRVLRPDHPTMLGVLRAAGEVELARGHVAEARALLERALAIGEATYGKDHVKLTATVRALAEARRRSPP